MITAALSQMIDQLPPEEYTMVEQYVNSIADMVAKHQKARAWEKIKSDLITSEKSLKMKQIILLSLMIMKPLMYFKLIHICTNC